jgi:hypothetical protein
MEMGKIVDCKGLHELVADGARHVEVLPAQEYHESISRGRSTSP